MGKNQEHEYIRLIGAREKNLKNVDVQIPKNKITVFTGVSGSGKSSLVFDTIAAESQRQLNETYSSFIRHRLPHYGQPKADAIENLSVAIIIDQKRIGGSARSTVGTITDIHALLRLLFSRNGEPFVGYSDVFSFNNPQGMCPECEGLGRVDRIDVGRLLDPERSLNEGAVLFPTFEPGGWRLKRYVHSGLFDNDKKLKDYTEREMELLLHENGLKLSSPDPEWPKTSLYEGLIPRIERSFLQKEEGERAKYKREIARIVGREICPACGGARLSKHVLTCTIGGMNIADCCAMPVSDLAAFIGGIDHRAAETMVDAIVGRLEHLTSIGLGYLSLDRETSTLSGGESQRIKMVRQLGSSLTGLLYIFDEPSIGLHPRDLERVNTLMRMLRDKGNTVLIVEHDPDVIEIADHAIEMGPEAGAAGGRIVYQGSLEGLKASDTRTGRAYRSRTPIKRQPRTPSGRLSIRNANLHNLKNVSVDIPRGVLTVVTGVAGSGKSTLINRVLPRSYPDIRLIDQKPIHASKRSNIATHSGIFDDIRELFAEANGVKASLFSFNSAGACPACKGLGITYTDLAFMDPVASVCERCGGRRFTEEVLAYAWNGKNISDVLAMTVDEALDFFRGHPLAAVLRNLHEAGVGYIALGQPLNTLSGGELQRVKLAPELDRGGGVYVLDEPTTGLHMSDVARLIAVLNRMVDAGGTVIVIEHNLDVVGQADWVIDLGPSAGREGGEILYSGEVRGLMKCERSDTGRYLKNDQKGEHDAE
ncbi:ATP-binding cassette domain-containing protein [Saccharibacillus alkalitolerans]|uniref:UvrABC system protein A n=1 Tax=Saccharibacillus alkalitolerans TaxID=2705290 RepID=A0ABX0F5W2_9BACL|nr:excinuclease ABC subunit UvrA [Saccharibacillus alkalitolerans]NGZ75315.1 excinuclease ABC subunit UvrA [Saccharibacillus alkalitolerans]